MKCILLSWPLFVLTASVSWAQTSGTAKQARPAQTNVLAASVSSKSDLSDKADKLNLLLNQGKIDEANTALHELHDLMVKEIETIQNKIGDATAANDEAEKNRCIDLMRNERQTYGEILQLRGDMIANRIKIHDKLAIFISKAE